MLRSLESLRVKEFLLQRRQKCDRLKVGQGKHDRAQRMGFRPRQSPHQEVLEFLLVGLGLSGSNF